MIEAVAASLDDVMGTFVKRALAEATDLNHIFSSGRLVGQTIRQGKRAIFFRYQLKPKGGINESEEMEKIIANATRPKGAKLDDIKRGFDDSGRKLNAMRSSIDGLGLPPLEKQEATNGPSDIYVTFGAKSSVPKNRSKRWNK